MELKSPGDDFDPGRDSVQCLCELSVSRGFGTALTT